MDKRESGIGPIGAVPWGAHFCQFYKTRDDLLGTLVPYFRAGLEENERCVWVVSDPLSVDDAVTGLRAEVPDVDARIERGQLTVLPHDEWYLKDGYFDIDRTFNGWLEILDGARARGYDGLRVTGNTAWLEEKDWADFEEYEHEIDRRIRDYPLIAL